MNNPKYKCLFNRVRPEGNIVQNHSHDYCELVYYRSGKGECKIDNYGYLYSEGSFCFVPRGIIHEESTCVETSVSCLIFDSGLCLNVGGLFEDSNKEFLYLIDEICKEIDAPSKHSGQIIENYLSLIEYKLLRMNGNDPYIKTDKAHHLDTTYNYILNYYNTDISIPELASMVSYSPDRFRHIFKDKYGISPKKLILRTRIEAAKLLIMRSDKENLTFEQISNQCGFTTPSQFCVAFKNIKGVTPSEYKTRNSKTSQTI